MALLSQAEFSRAQGWNKGYTTRLKQADRLVMVGGKVDVERSLARIKDTAHPSFKSPKDRAPVEHTPEMLESKRMKEFYAAQSAKLAYEVAAGKLVDAEEVRLFAADLGATFRNALEILADRLAYELVPLNDVDAVRTLLVESIEQMLHNLATKIEKGQA